MERKFDGTTKISQILRKICSHKMAITFFVWVGKIFKKYGPSKRVYLLLWRRQTCKLGYTRKKSYCMGMPHHIPIPKKDQSINPGPPQMKWLTNQPMCVTILINTTLFILRYNWNNYFSKILSRSNLQTSLICL